MIGTAVPASTGARSVGHDGTAVALEGGEHHPSTTGLSRRGPRLQRRGRPAARRPRGPRGRPRGVVQRRRRPHDRRRRHRRLRSRAGRRGRLPAGDAGRAVGRGAAGRVVVGGARPPRAGGGQRARPRRRLRPAHRGGGGRRGRDPAGARARGARRRPAGLGAAAGRHRRRARPLGPEGAGVAGPPAARHERAGAGVGHRRPVSGRVGRGRGAGLPLRAVGADRELERAAGAQRHRLAAAARPGDGGGGARRPRAPDAGRPRRGGGARPGAAGRAHPVRRRGDRRRLVRRSGAGHRRIGAGLEDGRRRGVRRDRERPRHGRAADHAGRVGHDAGPHHPHGRREPPPPGADRALHRPVRALLHAADVRGGARGRGGPPAAARRRLGAVVLPGDAHPADFVPLRARDLDAGDDSPRPSRRPRGTAC